MVSISCFGLFSVAVLLVTFFVISDSIISADAVPPRQQMQNGTSPLDVICGNNNHTLLIRASGDGTACASESSAKRLVGLGWIKVTDLLEDGEAGYFISVNNLVNSIYLFEERIVTVTGIVHRNNVAIPLVECNNNDTNSSEPEITLGYKPDKNSPYFVTDEMNNAVGVRVPFVKNNPVAINPDDLGDAITVTGIMRPIQFAPDWCDDVTLQKSAYLEVVSFEKNF